MAFFGLRVKQLILVWTDDTHSVISIPANSYPIILEEVWRLCPLLPLWVVHCSAYVLCRLHPV